MTVSTKTRRALHVRAQDCCEMCGKHGATNAHHRLNQSQGGHDRLSNLLLLCGSGSAKCHGFVTTNPTAAKRMGWTVRRNCDPALILVWRFDLTVGERRLAKLDDDGGIEYQESASFDELADRTSPLVQSGLMRYCKICHRAPGFDCVSPIDNGPLPGRVIHIERATREGSTP